MKKFTKVLLALLLALTMAFVFSACAGDDDDDGDGDGGDGGGTPGGGSTVVWQPTITAATEISGDEYIGTTGIKIDSKDELSFEAIDGGFKATLISGQYKQFCVQVGTAAGGSDYYASDGFTAVTNKNYTVTFTASVADGTGQIRINANGAPSGDDPWAKTEDLSTTEKAVTYSWKQDSGNLKFDTGSSVADTVIIIKGIKITTP